MGYLDNFMFEGEYISWTTDGANAGTVFYRNGKFNCTNVCGLLKLRNGFDTHFVSLVLSEATKKYVSINLANPKLMNNTMGNIQIRLPKFEEQKRISIIAKKQFAKYAKGSTIIHLHYKDIEKAQLLLPCLVEQNKMAACLVLLDEKIRIESSHLQSVVKQKMYLLHQMFI